jgi:hypothetical protein|tara:strand:- start:7990 stop:8298 length:309 start_codon:yes stop_codon:yes gene_type:complete
MNDPRRRAVAIERRYRMLTLPWRDIIVEIRAERGALLGTTEYSEMAGVEQAQALNQIDERLRTAEGWLMYYTEDLKEVKEYRVNKWLKKVALLSDAELEGEV